MSAFDKNISEEEIQIGFTPGEQGDETFRLETLDDYPGVMPEMNFSEEPIIPVEEGKPSLLSKENFDGFENIDQDYEDTEPEIESEDSSIYESENGINFLEANAFEDYVEEGELNQKEKFDSFESSSFGDDYNDFDDDQAESEATSENMFEDNELKQLLQDELDRARKNKKPEDTRKKSIFEDDEIEPVPESFVPVEDKVDTEVIELNEFDIDKPSNFGLNPPVENTIPNILDSILEKEELEKKPTQKEKKKKGGLFSIKMIIVYSSVAAVLVIAFIILLLTKTIEFGPKDKLAADTTKVIKKELPKKIIIPKPVEKIEVAKNEIDSLDNNNLDSANSETDEMKDKDSVLKENKTLENKDLAIKETILLDVKPKSIPKISPKEKPKRNVLPKNNYAEKSLKGIFTIEIVETYSMEDAEDWVSLLKSKGADNVIINVRQSRDKNVYCVRYGNFETYAQALEDGSNLGLQNFSIDRVK